MIKINHIEITYPKKRLIKESQIIIQNGELTCLIGESGIGKTSLLYLIGLLGNFSKNLDYQWDDHQLSFKDKELSQIRKDKIAFVFQEHNFFEHLTIYENFIFIEKLQQLHLTKEEMQDYLNRVYLDCDLNDYPQTMSGGEKQRLAIALALCKKPELLLLDEPTRHLDQQNANRILSILKDYANQYHTMVFMTTHSNEVKTACDRCYEIKNQQLHCLTSTKITKEKTLFHIKKRKNLHSFYTNYLKSYFKFHHHLYLFFILVCFIGLNLLVGSGQLSQIILTQQQAQFDQKFNHELLITDSIDQEISSSRYVPYFLNPIAKDTQESLNTIAQIEATYPYIETVVNTFSINDTSYDIACVIQPYFEESDTSYNQIEAYIDRRFYEDGQDLTFKTEINQQPFQINIAGPLPANTQNNYSNAVGIIIKVPYSQLRKYLQPDDKAMICILDHYWNYNQVYQQIQEIDEHLMIQSDEYQVSFFTKVTQEYRQIFYYIRLFIFIMTMILLIVSYKKFISNKQYDFALLKIQGLSTTQLLTLLVYENIGIFICLILSSSLLYIGASYFIPLHLIPYFKKLSIFIGVILISGLILSFTLIKKNSIRLLR